MFYCVTKLRFGRFKYLELMLRVMTNSCITSVNNALFLIDIYRKKESYSDLDP